METCSVKLVKSIEMVKVKFQSKQENSKGLLIPTIPTTIMVTQANWQNRQNIEQVTLSKKITTFKEVPSGSSFVWKIIE